MALPPIKDRLDKQVETLLRRAWPKKLLEPTGPERVLLVLPRYLSLPRRILFPVTAA
jgi:hypothetical protein